MTHLAGIRARRQRGTTIIEFALVAAVFFVLLIGIMEFGRWLFTMNAISEATRWGARLAVVCTKDAAATAIRNKMRSIAGSLTNANIVINYHNPPNAVNSCDMSNCKSVEVTITGATFTAIIPFMNFTNVPIPAFTTTLPRESMDSTNNDLICT
jgi:Flp pilus assembly protein TadG